MLTMLGRFLRMLMLLWIGMCTVALDILVPNG